MCNSSQLGWPGSTRTPGAKAKQVHHCRHDDDKHTRTQGHDELSAAGCDNNNWSWELLVLVFCSPSLPKPGCLPRRCRCRCWRRHTSVTHTHTHSQLAS